MEIIRPGTNIDFVGKRGLFGAISVGVVALCLILLVVPGPNYGIDFKGGTSIIVHFNDSVEPGDVTDMMVGLGFRDAVVQQFGTDEENQYVIQTSRISVITVEQANQVQAALDSAFDDLSFEFDQASGDRIEIRIPGGVQTPDATAEEVEPEGAIAEEATEAAVPGDADEAEGNPLGPDETNASRTLRGLLLEAGLNNPTVTQFGNPRHHRFLIRLPQLQSRVEAGLTDRFGETIGWIGSNRLDLGR